MVKPWHLLIAGLVFAASCADFPEIESHLTSGADQSAYPQLMSLAELGDLTFTADNTLLATASLRARVAALRVRARSLRDPVISAADMRLMQDAMSRHDR